MAGGYRSIAAAAARHTDCINFGPTVRRAKVIVCFVTSTFLFCPTSGLQLTVIWTMFMLVFGFIALHFGI